MTTTGLALACAALSLAAWGAWLTVRPASQSLPPQRSPAPATGTSAGQASHVAGEYTNQFGTEQYRVRLNTDGTFAFGYVGHHHQFRNRGRYSVSGDRVILAPELPDDGVAADTPSELIIVQRGVSSYLIEEDSMAAFCAYCADWPDPGDPGRPMEAIYYLRDGTLERTSTPTLPPEWQAYYESLLRHRLPPPPLRRPTR